MKKIIFGLNTKLCLSYLFLIILIFIFFGLAIYIPMTNYLNTAFLDAVYKNDSYNAKLARINQVIKNHKDIPPEIILQIANELDIIQFRTEFIPAQNQPNQLEGTNNASQFKKVSEYQRKAEDMSELDESAKELLGYLMPDSIGRIEVRASHLYKKATVEIFKILVTVSIPIILLGILLGFYISLRLTSPIRKMTVAAKDIADGNLTARLSVQRNDELGQLALQFNQMASHLEDYFQLLKRERDHLKDFIANISHELKNPLTALKTFNELLISDHHDSPPETRQLLDESQSQLERMDWLIQNLLKLSRLDAGLAKINFQQANLVETVRVGVRALKAEQFKKELNLEMLMEEDELLVYHDPDWMSQVITNVIHNSFKFTPISGSICVRVFREGTENIVEVADTGCGIKADELPHIFNRFFCREQKYDSRISGSGLGLAIVKTIVDIHQGEIEVTSVEGEGTIFRIILNPNKMSKSSPKL